MENVESPAVEKLSNNCYKFKELCLYEVVEELLGPTELNYSDRNSYFELRISVELSTKIA